MIIEAHNLSKKYNQYFAISDINFTINENELFGFIGPDGAGKTTIFRILATLMLPDSSNLIILGLNAFSQFKLLRPSLGYMPGRFSLYSNLTVNENLIFFATIYGSSVKENLWIIEDIYNPLKPYKDRLAGHLSGGMKQKLALCCALIHKPRILILDEPTTGVDAISRYEFWGLLKNLQKMGITVIVSTPYMDEANLCDRIALIQKGQVMKINTPQKIVQDYDANLYSICSMKAYSLKTDLLSTNLCKLVYLFGKQVHFTLKEKITPNEVEKALFNKGYFEINIQKIYPTIEDCFIILCMSL